MLLKIRLYIVKKRIFLYGKLYKILFCKYLKCIVQGFSLELVWIDALKRIHKSRYSNPNEFQIFMEFDINCNGKFTTCVNLN